MINRTKMKSNMFLVKKRTILGILMILLSCTIAPELTNITVATVQGPHIKITKPSYKGVFFAIPESTEDATIAYEAIVLQILVIP